LRRLTNFIHEIGCCYENDLADDAGLLVALERFLGFGAAGYVSQKSSGVEI